MNESTPPPTAPPEGDRIHIRNEDLDVVVLPRKGADLLDHGSCQRYPRAVQVTMGMARPGHVHTVRRHPARLAGLLPRRLAAADPNAGPERERDGVTHGYHGEAAITDWYVRYRDRSAVRLATRLGSVPLYLTRSLLRNGPTLAVHDVVTNTGRDPFNIMWVQHPAFGAPFIDADSRLDFAAGTFISDAESPGTTFAADTAYPLTTDSEPSESMGDAAQTLRRIPGPHSASSSFGCLTDLESGWYSITSPYAGFRIRVEWDATTFRHAWFWQECHASRGYPWFRTPTSSPSNPRTSSLAAHLAVVRIVASRPC